MKKITVFTPTFNRAHLLPRLYESLCSQTNKDFIWLVIDDGSNDVTEEFMKEWQAENKIQIQYKYKENGGMHTGHNLAYATIQTELNVCIDSDDWMPKDAIDLILNRWNSLKDKSNIAGIIGLDADKEGKIIGKKIPDPLFKGNLNALYQKHKVTGDKKLVLRTDVVRKYPPYPEYEGEKLVPLGLLYLMIEKDFDYIYANEVYCIVEYQEDGSSNSILKQYKQSPRGFAYARITQKKHSNSVILDLKNSMHLVSSAFFAKDFSLLVKGTKVYQNILMIPFGLLLHIYILIKTQ
jgi:glycosyltransferase involved in cell wall biosynthesis